MSNHSFDIHVATEYKSVDVAILVWHFQYWIIKNKRLKRNQIEGRTWTYQTIEEIAATFPYWSFDQIHRLLKKLVELKILRKGNFNKTTFDRTVWYAFENEEKFSISRFREMEEAESQNGFREIATPIPDTLTNTLPNKEGEEEAQPPCEPTSFIKKNSIELNKINSIITNIGSENLSLHDVESVNVKNSKKIFNNSEHKVNYQTSPQTINCNYQEKNIINETKIKENSFKNYKSCKKDELVPFGEYVKMTQAQYDKLCADLGKDLVDYYIEAINTWIPNASKIPKSYTATVRSWYLRDKGKGSIPNLEKIKNLSQKVDDLAKEENKKICEIIEQEITNRGWQRADICFHTQSDHAFLRHKTKDINKKYFYNACNTTELKKILQDDLRQVFPSLKIA